MSDPTPGMVQTGETIEQRQDPKRINRFEQIYGGGVNIMHEAQPFATPEDAADAALSKHADLIKNVAKNEKVDQKTFEDQFRRDFLAAYESTAQRVVLSLRPTEKKALAEAEQAKKDQAEAAKA